VRRRGRVTCATHFARGAGYLLVPATRLLKAALASAAMGTALVLVAPTRLWLSGPLGAMTYAVGVCSRPGRFGCVGAGSR